MAGCVCKALSPAKSQEKAAWLVRARIENLEAVEWTEMEFEQYGESIPVSLNKLCLVDCGETDRALHQVLVVATKLVSLTMSSDSKVTHVLLQHLPKEMKELFMRHIVLDHVDHQTQLPRSLTALACTTFGGDEAVRCLGQLTKLRRLELESRPGTILNVAWMANFQDLTSLTLLHLEPTHFGILPVSLRQLTVKVFDMTDDNLARLVRLGQLNTLTLDGCVAITDQGLRHLQFLPLRHVSLDSCTKVSNLGIALLVYGVVSSGTIMTIDATGTSFKDSHTSCYPTPKGWQCTPGDVKVISRE